MKKALIILVLLFSSSVVDGLDTRRNYVFKDGKAKESNN